MDDFDAAQKLEMLGCVTFARPLTKHEQDELKRYQLALPEDVRSDPSKVNNAVRDWARAQGL